MGSYLQAAVADRIKGQHGNIEVDEVGLVAVDGIEGAVVEVRNELLRRRTGTILPSPLCMDTAIIPRTLAHGMVLLVEHLRVETFPPFALTVFLGQVTVVVDTRLVTLQVIAL